MIHEVITGALCLAFGIGVGGFFENRRGRRELDFVQRGVKAEREQFHRDYARACGDLFVAHEKLVKAEAELARWRPARGEHGRFLRSVAPTPEHDASYGSIAAKPVEECKQV